MWWYHAYITSPTWSARRARHRRRHPWCMAHGVVLFALTWVVVGGTRLSGWWVRR